MTYSLLYTQSYKLHPDLLETNLCVVVYTCALSERAFCICDTNTTSGLLVFVL